MMLVPEDLLNDSKDTNAPQSVPKTKLISVNAGAVDTNMEQSNESQTE